MPHEYITPVAPVQSACTTILPVLQTKEDELQEQKVDAEVESHRQQMKHVRHKPTLSWDSLSEFSNIPGSNAIKRIVSDRINDLELCVRLGFKLWTYLGLGYKWSMALYQLILYALLLMPGFIQMIFFYFFSPRVIRSIPYGHGPRQRLDLYLPDGYDKDKTYPVVVFVTGGAWTIGYKAWGSLLARRLSSAGALVACLDYRNFPQGDALQMLEDVNTGIAWVCHKCARYQGDPDNILLVGQSAGGHLAALALMKQAEAAAGCEDVIGAFPYWDPLDIKAFVGISGAYDLQGLQQHLHERGLYKNLFEQIMSINGQPALEKLSPLAVARSWNNTQRKQQKLQPEANTFHPSLQNGYTHHDNIIQQDPRIALHDAPVSTMTNACNVNGNHHCCIDCDGTATIISSVPLLSSKTHASVNHDHAHSRQSHDCQSRDAVDGWLSGGNGEGAKCVHPASLMPHVVLIHGTKDKSVPHKGSTEMCSQLRAAGVSTSFKLIDGKTHTSFLLEGPMSGGQDLLMDFICPVLQSKQSTHSIQTVAQQGRPAEYPALCPALLCNLAGMVCPF